VIDVSIFNLVKSFNHSGTVRLAQLVDGKNVALIGNAKSLFGKRLGREIDDHETVIRLNWGGIIEPAQQGSRTTVIGTSRALGDDVINTQLRADSVVWLTSKRWKIPTWSETTWRKTDVMPLLLWYRLYRQLGYRPTSGLMMLYLIHQRLKPATLNLFGFDFYVSENFYSGMPKTNSVHSPALEKKIFEDIIASRENYHFRDR
jgi:Glycosyltransferase family 29 (sialyltransferase)